MAVDYSRVRDMLNGAINELRRVLVAIETEERAERDAETANAFARAPGTGTPSLTNAEAGITADAGTGGADTSTPSEAAAKSAAKIAAETKTGGGGAKSA